MEIKRYLKAYEKYSVVEFFNWASEGRVMEVRFLSDRNGNKFNNWELIENLAEALGIDRRYNSLFINSFAQLRKILLFKVGKYPATRLYNIFMGINPKRKIDVKAKNGLMFKSYYGGIAGTERIQNICADIEHLGERSGNATEEMLEECIQGAKYLIKLHELKNYYINISGNGTHLWIKLEDGIELPIPNFDEYPDKVKYRLKEDPIYSHIKRYNRFIEKLNRELKAYNPNLKVCEGAKDLSRILRPPGSWNVKIGKVARAVGTVVMESKINNNIKSNYMAVKLLLSKDKKNYHKKMISTSKHRYNHLNIRACPLYKLLVSRMLPSSYSRNHYLEQSFARILRDNDIKLIEIQELITEIDIVQRKNIQVDPDYLEGDEIFNSETVNSYCINSKIDLVYPILEDIPAVQDDYITEDHYKNLDNYSWSTVEKMVIKDSDNIKWDSYLGLKSIIRKLVNTYDKTSIFFTLKKILKDEWDYYNKNEIIVQLLNKTRRQK